MSQHKPNQQNILVKQNIATALFNLLAGKPLTEITIQEVCKRAQVSRMSFYRNFTSLEAVIENYIDNCFDEAINAIKNERPLNLKAKSILITTLEYFQKHTTYLKILVNQKLDILLLNCYNKAINNMYQEYQPALPAYCVNMLAGELFGLEMAWLRNGMQETPAQMAELYAQITTIKAQAFK